MGLFDWLRPRKNATPTASVVAETPTVAAAETSEREQFKSPSLLAHWVHRYVLEALPLADNYALLPDADTRKSLNITYEQRERYIREIAVLRVAGVSLFIKEHCDDPFWLTFSQTIYPLLAKYLGSESVPQLAEAVEGYVHCSLEKDDKQLSLKYLRRVYDDNDHFLRMAASGIGHLAIDWLMGSYEVFRDAYCRATQGMSYETFRTISDAMENAKAADTPPA